MNGGNIVVFATSFLDDLPTEPPGVGEGVRLLEELSDGSEGKVKVTYNCDRDPTEPLTPRELAGVRAVIADLEHYPASLLAEVGPKGGGSLELIARYGVGYDSVDLDAATKAGILVTNTPGANTVPTAEWAVATVLDIAGRRLPHHQRASQGVPKSGPSRLDVSGRTLGIVGTGAIGRTVAELLKGFNMHIIAYDPYPQEEWAEANGVTYVDFYALCGQADFITLHAATKKQLLGPQELSLMKPTTALINCARGVLVDERAAYEAVKEGRLFGYGLDEVWRHAELPLEGLNIAVSPHVGSDTDGGKAGMQQLSAEAVVDFFSGKTPRFALNSPEV
ncbi:MAG: NAD(P)-dependent oxidoreductase [Spirochaetaceae bacterium]